MTAITTTLHPSLDPVEETKAQDQLDIKAAQLRKDFDRFKRNPKARLLNRAALIAEACGNHPDGSLRYTTADVLGWIRRAYEMGGAATAGGPEVVEDIFRLRRVPNAPLRARFEHLHEETGLTSAEVALRIGVLRECGKGDSTRVERMLGLAFSTNGSGVDSVRLFVTYDQAVALCDALDLSYADVGV